MSNLCTVADVRRQLGLADGEPSEPGLTVFCSAGDATAATATVTATALVLVITGGTSAGTNSLTLANAANDTLAELVDAINALAGWTATRIGPASQASTALIQRGPLNVLGSSNTATPEYQDDAFLSTLIAASSDRIRRMTRRRFHAEDYVERMNPSGLGRMRTRHWPVIGITRISHGSTDALSASYSGSAIRASVQVGDTGVTLRSVDANGVVTTNLLTFATNASTQAMATAIDAVSDWTASAVANVPSVELNPLSGLDALNRTAMLTYPGELLEGWNVDYTRGIIDLVSDAQQSWEPPQVFGGPPRRGFQNVLIQYRAGYETLPPDLVQIAAEVTALAYRMAPINHALKSENLDQYSYTIANEVELTTDLRTRLAHWMEIR